MTQIVNIVGLWFLFGKLGIKKWKSLIPVYSYYNLGKAVGRKNDGVRYAVYQTLGRTISFLNAFYEKGTEEDNILTMLYILVAIPAFVFSARIFVGLCERFGKRRRWLILLILFEGWIMIYWSLSSKYVTVKLPSEEDEEEPEIDLSGLIGVDTVGSDEDLTINIRERWVMNGHRKRTLLRDIHMNIQPGHMVLLLGGSGSGKTTFLNAVTGYEKADADIELGRDNVYKDYDDIKYDIGFVPQQDLMRGSDTVYNTLADAAMLRLPTSVSAKEREDRIDEVLEQFGLNMLRSSLVDKLSGGQRKRLSTAMEYISDPRLFILDEPDSGLDGVVARSLFEKLREIADSGKIVIVITHTPDRVIDLFDDVIVLAKDSNRAGRLTYFGPIEKSYDFFGKDTMEGFLLAVNQKEEGGEGRGEELVKRYALMMKTLAAGGEA